MSLRDEYYTILSLHLEDDENPEGLLYDEILRAVSPDWFEDFIDNGPTEGRLLEGCIALVIEEDA